MGLRDTPIRIPTDDRQPRAVRVRVRVEGRVQGVGFRPTVYRHARAAGVGGFVLNAADGVRIEAEGSRAAVEAFVRRLREQPPPAARIDRFESEFVPVTGDRASFEIRSTDADGEVTTRIPPDLAVCAECVHELFDPRDRRHRYPFINCTNCGPRFTIIRDLPYDRPRTSMERFPMCPRCGAEYGDPGNRRFDAQPNACPVCGPRLELVDALGHRDADDPVTAAARRLRDGQVIGMLGLGGFHLAVDAFSPEAVARLRRRKGRPHKPFAVMFRDLDALRRHCIVDRAEIDALTGPEAPIVLLPARPSPPGGRRIAAEIAPDTSEIGAFLPATPLHHLVLESFEALVMTSGNLSEEPIVADESGFGYLLDRVADAALVHDRAVLHRCDDSVLRIRGARPVVLRRARGFVPNPVPLARSIPPVLACGGELKNTFCLAKGALAYPSQHIGDLQDYKTLRFYREEIGNLERLLDIDPAVVAHDLHPDYLATRYAIDRVGADRRIAVQHHHAHIASCLADNAVADGEVLGIAFDGTGYGPDGTIWGGEVLLAGYAGYRRIARILPVPLPGGDAAIREPRRAALSWLCAAFGADGTETQAFADGAFAADETRALLSMIESGVRSPLTSSAGRFFDAATAILGLCDRATYEAQAAVRLEQAASLVRDADPLPWDLDLDTDPWTIDLRPAVIRLACVGREDPAVAAAAVHATLAAAAVQVCRRAAADGAPRRVALSGGCFQNGRLLGETMLRLERSGFRVYVHLRVPPNDGGISLGQAAVAAAVVDGRER